MKILARGKFSRVRFSLLEGEGCWELRSALREEKRERERARKRGTRNEESELKSGWKRRVKQGPEDSGIRKGGGRRRTRIRPLRGPTAGASPRKRSKMFWKQRSLSLSPSAVSRLVAAAAATATNPQTLSLVPLSRFRRYNSRLHRHEARPPYIFRI